MLFLLLLKLHYNIVLPIKYFFSIYRERPDHLLMILHETPASRFSLIPGDFLSPGSKIEKIKFGELTWLGIGKRIKKMPIQRDMGNCREYEFDDSQEKCYVREVLAKIRYGNISNICELEEECAIPQIKDILGM